MLKFLIIISLLWVLVLGLMKDFPAATVKRCGLWFSLITFILSIMCLVEFNPLVFGFQQSFLAIPNFFIITNSSFRFGLDGISVYFVILSAFLIFLSILCGWDSIRYRIREYIFILILTDFLLICFFSVQDMLGFYVLFESLLIPMYFLIGVWGSRNRRVHAAYNFFFFTLFGSLFMLLGLLYIFQTIGGTDFFSFHEWCYYIDKKLIGGAPFSGNDLVYLYREYRRNTNYTVLDFIESIDRRVFIVKCVWFSIFLGLSIKIPMVPFHLWLPEAHVEAPTGGSVLLAGIMLKMGGYGYIRLLLPFGEEVNYYFLPFIYLLCMVGIVYTSLVTMRQVDLKKIIAYSSIGHMNYVTLGIFSYSVQGIVGSIFLMLSHGFVSSGLFLCVGMLYDRYGTRLVVYYGGLVQFMPIYSILFFFFILANIGFPGTSGFIGEILILSGLIKMQLLIVLISLSSVILSAIYSMWCFNRVIFGQVGNYEKYSDVNQREFFILVIIFIPICILGIFPNLVLDIINFSVEGCLV